MITLRESVAIALALPSFYQIAKLMILLNMSRIRRSIESFSMTSFAQSLGSDALLKHLRGGLDREAIIIA